MKPHCLLLSVLLGAFGGSTLAAEKPNLIFILADDLGYGDLSCYGQKTLATPNLDRMAAEGMRFTAAQCGQTTCRLSDMAGSDYQISLIYGRCPGFQVWAPNLKASRALVSKACGSMACLVDQPARCCSAMSARALIQASSSLRAGM